MPILTYNSYFDKLPLIKYDINNVRPKRYETVTNIFFRVRVIQNILNNIDSYVVGEIEEGETPEIVAEKVYNDAGAAWIITIANNIIDPQWEWPLHYAEFQNYIIGKYGSIQAAKTTIHHYEMVITRSLSPDNITTEHRFTVNKEKLTDQNLSVPYNYFTPHMSETHDDSDPTLQPGSLAAHEYVNVFEVAGKTVTEVINGQSTDCYDYESAVNEKKRFIKIIKAEYYDEIMKEFVQLTGGYKTPTVRTVM